MNHPVEAVDPVVTSVEFMLGLIGHLPQDEALSAKPEGFDTQVAKELVARAKAGENVQAECEVALNQVTAWFMALPAGAISAVPEAFLA
ncbi:hypothetical protein ACYPKM_00790 [Pseudomonas aeruginosa]